MRDLVDIGMGRTARQTFELDDITIVPSRRTRSSSEVSTAWQLDAYRFDIPLLTHPTDAVVSPPVAVEVGRLGGLGVHQYQRLHEFLVRRQAPRRPAEPEARGSRLVVLAGPTAVGKGTVAGYIREHYPDVQLSVSATTRPPRPGEVDGVHYHFVDTETFKKMAADGAFLEWAHVFGHRYGTPRAPVEAMLAAGKDVLFDIDWQGAQQLYQEAGPDVVRVFVLPPTME